MNNKELAKFICTEMRERPGAEAWGTHVDTQNGRPGYVAGLHPSMHP